MLLQFRSKILYSLIVLSYVLFSYYFFGRWWNSSLGTLLILFFSYLIWKKDFLNQIGLDLDIKTSIKTIILVALITACAFFLMKYIANKHNIQIRFTNWQNYYHTVFYILNEEIVLGAMLLFSLVRKRKIKPIFASIVLAVLFAIIHFVFYKWIFFDRGIIGISTLITLFLVGYIRNSLILQTGLIAYSWALHFGWMVIMFGCMHIDLDNINRVSELDRFNLYLGSAEMLVLSGIIAGTTLVYWLLKYSPKQKLE